MHFPPFFIPFQSFFSPNLLFRHIFFWGGQTEKYTPLITGGYKLIGFLSNQPAFFDFCLNVYTNQIVHGPFVISPQ